MEATKNILWPIRMAFVARGICEVFTIFGAESRCTPACPRDGITKKAIPQHIMSVVSLMNDVSALSSKLFNLFNIFFSAF